MRCAFFFGAAPRKTAADFSGSFPPEMRYFPLQYTKYSCGKISFSDAKSHAEFSCRFPWSCPWAVFRTRKQSADFGGSFSPGMRPIILQYTKYSCGKISFSDAKSHAEFSCRFPWSCPWAVFRTRKQSVDFNGSLMAGMEVMPVHKTFKIICYNEKESALGQDLADRFPENSLAIA